MVPRKPRPKLQVQGLLPLCSQSQVVYLCAWGKRKRTDVGSKKRSGERGFFQNQNSLRGCKARTQTNPRAGGRGHSSGNKKVLDALMFEVPQKVAAFVRCRKNNPTEIAIQADQ